MKLLSEEQLFEEANKYHQEHIIGLYKRLDDEGKKKLLEDVSKINFEEIEKLFELTKAQKNDASFEVEALDALDANAISKEEKTELVSIGEEAIKNGEYAVVMMAGGQGTRLGFNGPKGTFDFGLASHKTIFETYVDQFKEAKEKYGVDVPFYIMTSYENNDATVKFFEEHNYFDYPGVVKKFFIQDELPMLDEQGKIILTEEGSIKLAANGHGGTFEAMANRGVLDELKANNVKYIFACNVDNTLAKLVDPLLVGTAIKNSYVIVSVSCYKSDPEEKIGVIGLRDGKPSVVEYTEIPDSLKLRKKENGEPFLSEGHLNMNLFDVSFVNEFAAGTYDMPYHVAHKKCDIVDEDGNVTKPDAPNAYKFEKFIFDSFSHASGRFGVLRYKREECFAPIKNAEGVDSPATARALYNAYHGL